MKDYEFMISQFIDNELSENEQQELFHYLSEDLEARQTLVDFLELKKETKSFYSGMKLEIDDSKVLTDGITSQNKRDKKYKTMFYYSAVASIVFLFLFIINQFKENPILAKYQSLQTEMIILQENYSDALNKQSELLLSNNLLFAETNKLKTSQVAIDGKPVKGKKTSVKNKHVINKNRHLYSASNSGRMLAVLPNVQTIEITENDFLGGRIIGN